MITSTTVSIPFEQGDVFRPYACGRTWEFLSVSIPFEQGDVFRPIKEADEIFALLVSIPFEQGDVFRLTRRLDEKVQKGLNPFRAGRCLSTEDIWLL